MTKLDLSADDLKEATKGGFHGIQKGITKDAKINEEKTDTNGRKYYNVQFDISYTGTDDKEKTKRCFGRIPLWRSDPEFQEFCDIIGADDKKLMANFEKEINGKSICIKIGADRERIDYEKTGKVKEYNGHVSLCIVGFAAFNRAATAWTPEDEAREVAAYEEFKSYSDGPEQEVDESFGEKPSEFADGERVTAKSVEDDSF